MVKMRILVGSVAGGRAWAVGDIADLSKADADLLRMRGLAEVVEAEPLAVPEEELPEAAAEEAPAEEPEPETETATLEPPENAMQKPPKGRKSKRGK
jgi:hypothetical protein